jgi:hypothetical protein
VTVWRRYAQEADVFGALQKRLPQLGVPIRDGISKTEPYRLVARRGERCTEETFGELLALEQPKSLRLRIHDHPAGALPVLSTPQRSDFETLVRALAFRSEPSPISPSVNAQTVGGFINWDRVHSYRHAWVNEHGDDGWFDEMARVARSEVWRFHDRFVLTCDGPYSGVSAAALGLAIDEAAWLEKSHVLRVEHELTHYATRRVFGSMSLNLLDETICDCMGMTAALGEYRAAHYLRFLGLEAWPELRAEGRVHTYTKELEGPAVELLCSVVVHAAENLETIAERFYDDAQRGRFLLALSSSCLELLASDAAEELFAEAWETAGRLTTTVGEARVG